MNIMILTYHKHSFQFFSFEWDIWTSKSKDYITVHLINTLHSTPIYATANSIRRLSTQLQTPFDACLRNCKLHSDRHPHNLKFILLEGSEFN